MHKRTMILVVNLVFTVIVSAQAKMDTINPVSLNFSVAKDSLKHPLILPFSNRLPGNYYSKNLPFFCGKELQIQKTTGIALKFRLGSVDYVNKLEGKH